MITANEWYEIPETERHSRLWDKITDYKATETYRRAFVAQEYFMGRNYDVLTFRKPITGEKGKLLEEKFPVMNRIFYRLVLQMSQYSLTNGITINKGEQDDIKDKLGKRFDTRLLRMGEVAIIQGACYAFWNNGEIVYFTPLEFIPLYDEWSGEMVAGIRFWQTADDRPMYVQIFEKTGITDVELSESGVVKNTKQQSYSNVNKDQMKRGRKLPEMLRKVIGGGELATLPIRGLYANPERESQFTADMRANVFRYDRIATDFGSNLDMANDIYWVINNFGGSVADVKRMLKEISELKATYADGDGATAVPHTMEVPHEARRIALEILNSLIIANFCGIDILKVEGGARTATEIKLSTIDLNNLATRFESEVYSFVQELVELAIGIEVEDISFKRNFIVNEEMVANMLMALATNGSVDERTLLEKHPLIDADSVDTILERMALELFDDDEDDDEPDDGAQEE